MRESRNTTIAQVLNPKIMTSWMLRASFMARQMVSPTDCVEWNESESDRMCATSWERRVWIMYSAVRAIT